MDAVVVPKAPLTEDVRQHREAMAIGGDRGRGPLERLTRAAQQATGPGEETTAFAELATGNRPCAETVGEQACRDVRCGVANEGAQGAGRAGHEGGTSWDDSAEAHVAAAAISPCREPGHAGELRPAPRGGR